MESHKKPSEQVKQADAYVRECNEGKQKLVDDKKKALAKLSKEKGKIEKLEKEVKSLKKSAGKKKTGGGQTDSDSAEIARMKKDLEAATKENSGMKKQLETASKENSELKSRLASNRRDSTPDEGMEELEEENDALKKENQELKKQLEEALASKGLAGRDPYAGKRNRDVNAAVETFVRNILRRKVIFMPTQEDELEAMHMVWDALKVKESLEVYHKLTQDTFTQYHGPKVKEVLGQKRSDLQAAMKRSARGKR